MPMAKGQLKKLTEARARLGEAMQEGNPKKIAEAAVRVMAADPMTTDMFMYLLRLYPLFSILIRTLREYNYHSVRWMVESEMRKIDKQLNESLPKEYRRIIIKSFTHTLKQHLRAKKALNQ